MQLGAGPPSMYPRVSSSRLIPEAMASLELGFCFPRTTGVLEKRQVLFRGSALAGGVLPALEYLAKQRVRSQEQW